LSLAKQQHERNLTLIKSDAISKQALDESQAALKVAEAGIESIKAQIQEAESTLKGDKANLSYTKIYAPIDGSIVSESAKEGQTLNSNQTAPTILQVANLDIMTVRAQVAEADIMRLKPDMKVYFTVLGSLDRRWKGKITQLLPSPETVSDVVLYIALIDVDNTDRQLLTGMSAQVFFTLGSARDTLLIPTTALGKRVAQQDNEQGTAYEVKVRQGGAIVDKVIYVGLSSRGKAQVVSGLSEGDEVVNNERPVAAGSSSTSGSTGGGARGAGRFGPRL
jgi:macrolide-specific efflux system membrane fusion protein